jgi:uncharacterized membrane protein YgdD (TMEM256/DUF423 family)
MAYRNAIAAASGCSAVLLGAFGAHGLKGIDPSLLATWNTAAHYHLVHSLALVHVSRLGGGAASSLSYNLFASGIALFSGSLYLLVLTRYKPLGAITPIGGLLLAGAWASLAF